MSERPLSSSTGKSGIQVKEPKGAAAFEPYEGSEPPRRRCVSKALS
jgi:hypothetical protein